MLKIFMCDKHIMHYQPYANKPVPFEVDSVTVKGLPVVPPADNVAHTVADPACSLPLTMVGTDTLTTR